MDLSVDEIRTLLGICVGGLRHVRENDKHLRASERDLIHNMEIRVEEVYDNLCPLAPDVGEEPNGS